MVAEQFESITQNENQTENQEEHQEHLPIPAGHRLRL